MAEACDQAGTNQTGKNITLIVPEPEAVPQQARPDRGGGETHAWGMGLFRRLKPKSVSQEEFLKNAEQTLDQLQAVLAKVKRQRVDGWELDTMTISLAVSAEGSIGIATAGAETSIAVSFKRT